VILLFAGLELDKARHLCDVLVALDAGHLGVLDLGVGVEEFLDLPGIGFHQAADSRCADFDPRCQRQSCHL
jgi:hypothetical protein